MTVEDFSIEAILITIHTTLEGIERQLEQIAIEIERNTQSLDNLAMVSS